MHNTALGRPNSAGHYYISEGEMRAAIKSALRAHSSHVHTLERRLREVTNQRDKAKGRVRELQAYVTKYQREIADLKRFIRNTKDPS